MPSKKKKYNARFPAGRIKRIMQSDEEIGKVAQAVPVIISRTLELFVESLLTKTLKITNSRNAKTLSPSHMKQCIMAESRFDFLRELVKNVPDISVAEEAANDVSSPEQSIDPDTPYDLSMPSTSSIQNLPLSIGTTSSSYANHAETSRVRNGVSNNKGQTSITSTTSATVTSSIPSFSDSSTTPIDTNSPSYMKRQLNCNNRLRRCLETQADSTTTTNTTTNSSSSAEIAVPSSVIRHTSSELAATAISSHDTQEFITPPKSGRNSSPTEATPLAIDYTKQHHQLSEHDIPTNYSIKRSNVQRLEKTNIQSKSTLIPATSIKGGQLKQNQQTHQNHPQPKQTAIPAPVFHIDFCNKPVVKIDYSNLTPIDDAMRDLTEDSKSKLQQSPNIDSSSSLATTTTASLSSSSMPSSLKCSPIVNIDLSNIISNSNTANRPALTMGNSLQKSTIQANAKVASALNKNSYLELDEDYDNI